jgi:hypothetical protein
MPSSHVLISRSPFLALPFPSSAPISRPLPVSSSPVFRFPFILLRSYLSSAPHPSRSDAVLPSRVVIPSAVISGDPPLPISIICT